MGGGLGLSEDDGPVRGSVVRVLKLLLTRRYRVVQIDPPGLVNDRFGPVKGIYFSSV